MLQKIVTNMPVKKHLKNISCDPYKSSKCIRVRGEGSNIIGLLDENHHKISFTTYESVVWDECIVDLLLNNPYTILLSE